MNSGSLLIDPKAGFAFMYNNNAYQIERDYLLALLDYSKILYIPFLFKKKSIIINLSPPF